MGYYYYGKKNNRVEFDDTKPPQYRGGNVVLAPGTPRDIFEKNGLKVVSYYSWGDMYVVEATIDQLNSLYESKLATTAEPNLIERFGPRLWLDILLFGFNLSLWKS